MRARGRPWSNDEENQLRQLVKEGKNFDEISSIMGKSRLSVKGKLFNSGLNCVEVATHTQRAVATTTSPRKDITDSITAPIPAVVDATENKVTNVELKLPERLPSVEDELKILAAAVEALRQPGLSRAEVSRLHNIILGVNLPGAFRKVRGLLWVRGRGFGVEKTACVQKRQIIQQFILVGFTLMRLRLSGMGFAKNTESTMHLRMRRLMQ